MTIKWHLLKKKFIHHLLRVIPFRGIVRFCNKHLQVRIDLMKPLIYWEITKPLKLSFGDPYQPLTSRSKHWRIINDYLLVERRKAFCLDAASHDLRLEFCKRWITVLHNFRHSWTLVPQKNEIWNSDKEWKFKYSGIPCNCIFIFFLCQERKRDIVRHHLVSDLVNMSTVQRYKRVCQCLFVLVSLFWEHCLQTVNKWIDLITN